MSELLAPELRDPVRGDRSGLGLLGRRIPLSISVDGRRGREDDTRASGGGGLEYSSARQQVSPHVVVEDVAEAAHARLPCEVEDAVDPGKIEILLCEIDACDVEPGGVLLLQRLVVIVGEAVDADDLVP